VHAVSGGALYRKTSFLLDSLGKQVFPDFVRISERPHIRGGFASSPSTTMAWPRAIAKWSRTACCRATSCPPIPGASWACRPPAMPAVRTTCWCRGGTTARPVARDGRGLLVTELLGQGVNYVTGDYSRGAPGYWVENGEIAYPVEEITIAGNLRDMLRGIVDIGNDVEVRGSKQVGSILIERMTVAGN
jgi:PmbA protein